MHGFKGVLKIKSSTNQSTQNSFGTLDTGSRLSFPAIPKTPSYHICGTIVISYQINWLPWCKIECSTSQVHYHHFILNRILIATNNSATNSWWWSKGSFTIARESSIELLRVKQQEFVAVHLFHFPWSKSFALPSSFCLQTRQRFWYVGVKPAENSGTRYMKLNELESLSWSNWISNKGLISARRSVSKSEGRVMRAKLQKIFCTVIVNWFSVLSTLLLLPISLHIKWVGHLQLAC